jgi:C4-dicarboxylate-specific signal transduction histidine kinase
MSTPGHSQSSSQDSRAGHQSSTMVIPDTHTVRSPLGVVAIIVTTVFFSETFEMIFFSFLPPFPLIYGALADAVLLIVLISPVLYFFVYRPLVEQIKHLDRAEQALQEANLELENKMDVRTAELTTTNATLRQEIADRKLAEEELKRETELNATLSELYEPLISPSAKITDIAFTVLDKAKNLTRSEHGYVSSIDPETGGNVSHTLTEMLEGQCNVSADQKITFPIGRDGRYSSLCGHALNTCESFYTNSPVNHSASAGIPEGHIPLERFLSVPVLLGDELVGQIALANKKTDYSGRDLESIERVAEFYALALQRNRAEQALQDAKAELEERVVERTKKLMLTNMKLRKEVTERASAEQKLMQSKSTLQAVVDGISDPLILLKNDMTVRMLNKAAADYYGLSGYKDILDSKCHQMLRASAAPCEGCEVPATVSSGKSMMFERPGFMDAERLEQVFLYPVKTGNGSQKDVLLRISDITEQRLLEKQIIQSEKMASLGTMVSSVAHEINNPINFISFNIPILRDYINELLPIIDAYADEHPGLEICHLTYPDFREDIRKLLDNVEHGSGRITDFVASLKDFSQLKEKVRENWVDLNTVLDKVLAIFRAQLKEGVKKLITDLPEKSQQIWTDANALEQVLLNLLVNAANATDKENSRVELNVEIRDSWLEHIIFEIRDNGSGMDEKTLQKIYDPFFTTRSDSGGTGLGLYVSHSLVEGLRGRIQVESKPGKGSAFRVILPDRDRRRKKRI